MKHINYILGRLPIFIFLSAVALDIILTNCSMTDDKYWIVFFYMNEVLNASILTNVFILLACYRYKLCAYNKVSVFGLLSMNCINMMFIGSNDLEVYGYIFTHAIMIPLAVLSIILMIKKI